MGPIIILDKSTLQSLSPEEINFLYRYYLVNITPVLVIEILGDLKKPTSEGSFSKEKVIELSNKLGRTYSAVNVHYQTIVAASLDGYKVITDGRPNLQATNYVEDVDGKTGVIIEQSPEEQAINRWRLGLFTEAEAILAEEWREVTKEIDLNSVKEQYKAIADKLKAVGNIGKLNEELDTILLNPSVQNELLTLLLIEFSFNPTFASTVIQRWNKRETLLLKDFSPYAFYCFKVSLLFYFGLARGYIGTKPTNRIDLEYLYYLPFAMAFSSNDRFHKTVAPLLLRANQVFVDGDALKSDLKSISEEWISLNEMEREEWDKKNKIYPPENENSVTFELWNKFMLPRKRLEGSPNQTSQGKTSIDDVTKIQELMKMAEEGKAVFGKFPNNFDGTKIDFIVRRRKVHINDPCPCGSGKRLRDCHLEQVRKKESH